MSLFKDLFSQQSADYQKFRPTYPPELYAYLAALSHDHDLAIDCGTGNGQAATELAPYFKRVLGTDASAAQIEKAQAREGVEYLVSVGEQIPVADHAADLVTVAQAFHWFKHDLFLKEAQRALKSTGHLAIWIYNLCEIKPAVDKVMREFYDDLLGPYWEPERKSLEQNFSAVHFPLVELAAPIFQMQRQWTLDILMGYLGTWSSLQTYRQQTGQDPLPEFREKFAAVWGASSALEVRWQIRPRLFKNLLK